MEICSRYGITVNRAPALDWLVQSVPDHLGEILADQILAPDFDGAMRTDALARVMDAMCRFQRDDLVRALVACGMPVDSCDSDGMSLLRHACRHADVASMMVLLHYHANPNARIGHESLSLLSWASGIAPPSNAGVAVRTLLCAGADVDQWLAWNAGRPLVPEVAAELLVWSLAVGRTDLQGLAELHRAEVALPLAYLDCYQWVDADGKMRLRQAFSQHITANAEHQQALIDHVLFDLHPEKMWHLRCGEITLRRQRLNVLDEMRRDGLEPPLSPLRRERRDAEGPARAFLLAGCERELLPRLMRDLEQVWCEGMLPFDAACEDLLRTWVREALEVLLELVDLRLAAERVWLDQALLGLSAKISRNRAQLLDEPGKQAACDVQLAHLHRVRTRVAAFS
ncbi:hypothetical protein [Paraburkholderia hayleyella]|uniref:hypothetical protein n=1 Tax=Paraburkholderia hayleyella TaxID=2152889 RepID=UPI001291B6AD|nr:hypothetical protein [Paraburkholderia hayleyella]